jgi:hypothetical protein
MPETRCTNTNLSLHFSVNSNVSVSHSGDHGYLRDDGGFSEISPEIPLPRWDDGDPQWRDVGSIPRLKRNSEILAWWNNQFVAQTLNISSSHKGKIYTDQISTFGKLSEAGAIKISTVDGMFLDDLYYNKRDDKKKQFDDYG